MKTNSTLNKQTEKGKLYIECVGRHKSSSARVRLYFINRLKKAVISDITYKGGDFIVNGRKAEEYFPGALNKQMYEYPLVITDTKNSFVVSVKVTGGGVKGQLGATIHGLSRVLDSYNTEQYHTILKKEHLLTRDSRMKERRKAGYAGKARARKQSPKR